MLPQIPHVARKSGATGGSVDSTPEAARLLNARRFSVPARDESHHAHVPAGLRGLGRHRLAQTARGLPRVPAGSNARRAGEAAVVRVGSDGLAGRDRTGY